MTMEACPAQYDIAQLLSAPPPFSHPPSQRLVGIHSRKVCWGVFAPAVRTGSLQLEVPVKNYGKLCAIT